MNLRDWWFGQLSVPGMTTPLDWLCVTFLSGDDKGICSEQLIDGCQPRRFRTEKQSEGYDSSPVHLFILFMLERQAVISPTQVHHGWIYLDLEEGYYK